MTNSNLIQAHELKGINSSMNGGWLGVSGFIGSVRGPTFIALYREDAMLSFCLHAPPSDISDLLWIFFFFNGNLSVCVTPLQETSSTVNFWKITDAPYID